MFPSQPDATDRYYRRTHILTTLMDTIRGEELNPDQLAHTTCAIAAALEREEARRDETAARMEEAAAQQAEARKAHARDNDSILNRVKMGRQSGKTETAQAEAKAQAPSQAPSPFSTLEDFVNQGIIPDLARELGIPLPLKTPGSGVPVAGDTCTCRVCEFRRSVYGADPTTDARKDGQPVSGSGDVPSNVTETSKPQDRTFDSRAGLFDTLAIAAIAPESRREIDRLIQQLASVSADKQPEAADNLRLLIIDVIGNALRAKE